jgi:uncharacterized damage-inducible protein DinB
VASLDFRFPFAYLSCTDTTASLSISRSDELKEAPVNTLEFCIARRKSERPAFLKVLKAVPQDKLDYRPDPKARTAAELVWTIATEEVALATLLESGSVDWKDEKPPANVEDMVAAYERGSAAVDEQLAKLDEAGWQKKGQFLMGGKPVWEDAFSGFAWGFLFDLIHHRGQLSTYLRPMGSKVPAIYGPSADDPGQ